jgi:hypothetical protein
MNSAAICSMRTGPSRALEPAVRALSRKRAASSDGRATMTSASSTAGESVPSPFRTSTSTSSRVKTIAPKRASSCGTVRSHGMSVIFFSRGSILKSGFRSTYFGSADGQRGYPSMPPEPFLCRSRMTRP